MLRAFVVKQPYSLVAHHCIKTGGARGSVYAGLGRRFPQGPSRGDVARMGSSSKRLVSRLISLNALTLCVGVVDAFFR